MFLILGVWLAVTIPVSPWCTHFSSELGLAETEFLRDLQDKQDERPWEAGTYRGITIGKSTDKELFQKWGEPKWSGHWEWDNPQNPKFLLYDYAAQEEFIIKIRVETDTKTGKVISIDIWADELQMSKAIELFGKDYIETRYKFCDCEFGDGAPIFESPDGNLRSIEYRGRGIAMTADFEGKVTSIRFVDKPIGFKSAKDCEKSPQCKPKRKTRRRNRI